MRDVSNIDSKEEISDDQTNALEVISAGISISTASVPLFHDSNSSGDSSKISPVNSPKVEQERVDRFNLNTSTLYPLCNREHKEKSIWNDIKGEWGAGEYYGERTYRLKCRDPLNREIPIVSIKA
ncbi:hypothetical protein C1646_822288 [Rhizophagus diaphanus]|nr:hypothetical protein C1646_822288 [Rhizophagus diaphanus] [Rhizophagus sp. MUCL 43196]